VNADVARARAMLVRALENLDRYERGTYGHRDAVHRDIPNAVEALIEAKMAAMRRAALATASKNGEDA
jgi:hypothetical protein